MSWKYVQRNTETGQFKTTSSGGGGSSTFADLEDVSFSNLQNGQVPKYNSTTQKWENANESGGGGSVTDVQVDGVSVVNGQGIAEITTPTPMHNYSTTEQVIGTWIDGKPLYERTIHISQLPYNGTSQIETLTNVDKVVFFRGFCSSKTTNGYQRPIPLPDGNNDIRVDVSNYVLQIKTLADWSSYEGWVTIQYTKSTD